MKKYISFYSKEQTRLGNGVFATSRHVATNDELNAKARQQAKNDADPSKQAEMQALGLGDYDYSEVFAA